MDFMNPHFIEEDATFWCLGSWIIQPWVPDEFVLQKEWHITDIDYQILWCHELMTSSSLGCASPKTDHSLLLRAAQMTCSHPTWLWKISNKRKPLQRGLFIVMHFRHASLLKISRDPLLSIWLNSHFSCKGCCYTATTHSNATASLLL